MRPFGDATKTTRIRNFTTKTSDRIAYYLTDDLWYSFTLLCVSDLCRRPNQNFGSVRRNCSGTNRNNLTYLSTQGYIITRKISTEFLKAYFRLTPLFSYEQESSASQMGKLKLSKGHDTSTVHCHNLFP